MSALKIGMQPTRAIMDVALLLDQGIASYQSARHKVDPEWSRYDSNTEALTLFNLVIRNVGGVASLAKSDLLFLPPAYAASRSSLETSIKIMWMLKPTNVFEREARYLAHLASEENYYRRNGELIENNGAIVENEDAAEWKKAEQAIKDFRCGIEAMLPPPVKPLKKLPTFRAMLVDLGLEYIYREYIHLSQFSHGTHLCRSLYRQVHTDDKFIGDFVSPELWVRPLVCSWKSLYICGSTILEKLGGDPIAFVSPEFKMKVNEALSRV
jgi:hypothetical protein